MDLDPDPAIFVIDLQDASKTLIFNTIFSAYYFLKLHLHHFSKIKSQKESQNSTIIEGSGSRAGSGSGSGSWRPKNMWICWIRIRIRNTGVNCDLSSGPYGLLAVMVSDRSCLLSLLPEPEEGWRLMAFLDPARR
jgi:hypothetical protein